MLGVLLSLLLLPAHSAAACGWAGDGEARAAAEAEVVVVGRDGQPLSDDERADAPSATRQTEPKRGNRHRDGAAILQDDR